MNERKTYDQILGYLETKYLVGSNPLGPDRINGHRWTNEELKFVANAWQQDVPAALIAKKIGVSEYAVRKMVFRLRSSGIPLRYHRRGHVAGRRNVLWTQAEVEYLIRRRKDRATAEEIAAELNRTFYGVQAMIQKLKSESVNVGMMGRGVRKLWNPDVLRMDVSDVYSVN